MNKPNPMTIAVDFDGTCVTHEYPRVGRDIGAVPVLKALVASGHKLILFTMRSDSTLNDAVNWFYDNGISLYGIQTNPTQSSWTRSPKALADLYIDDAALGCPLIEFGAERPYVDWKGVEALLTSKGVLKDSVRSFTDIMEVKNSHDDYKTHSQKGKLHSDEK